MTLFEIMLCDELVKGVGAVDTEKLLKKIDCDNKTSGFEGKVPNITGLATTTALTTVETKTLGLRTINRTLELAIRAA